MNEIAMFERIGKLVEENERLIGEVERLREALTEIADMTPSAATMLARAALTEDTTNA